MTNGWQEVPLGKVLKRADRFEKKDELQTYHFAGTYSFARGIFASVVKEGSTFGLDKIQRIKKGDFIYCKIMAWEGAFGIAPEKVDNFVMSGAFVAYEVDQTQIYPKFLDYYFKQEPVWKSIGSQSTGTNVRRRSLHPDQFEKATIPIPPLDEQQRIVERVDAFAACISKAQSLRDEAQESSKFLQASIMNAVFEGDLVLTEENSESATELVERNMRERRSKRETDVQAKGKDPNKVKYEELQLPNTNELPTLPNHWRWITWEMLLAHEDGAFRRGPFGSTLRKSIFVESGYKVYEQYCPINDDCSFGRYYITPELFKKLKSFEVKAGDYLISCSGVTLGRITQVPQGSDEGIINQALLRVRINNKIIDDKYFLYCFRAPFFQKLLFVNSTGSAIPNLKGVKELKAIPLPLPPLDEQRRIVAYLDSVQARLASLRQLQSETGEELSALLPSVLDKAFKGEL